MERIVLRLEVHHIGVEATVDMVTILMGLVVEEGREELQRLEHCQE